MARNTRLTRAAERVGAATGRASGRAHKLGTAARVAAKELRRLRGAAQRAAAKELGHLRKRLDRLTRDLEKASKRIRRSLR